MERADGNRRMWLLKSTSGHHRPECLAAALALGILAGLVPKLNLLAVVLYGLIFVLPIHTSLALVVSAIVALCSFQLDAVAHDLGTFLLRQDALQPLWSSLDRAPLAPWLSLHNTVVLGHFMIGTVLLAPMYMISVRIFERLEYGGASRSTVQTGLDPKLRAGHDGRSRSANDQERALPPARWIAGTSAHRVATATRINGGSFTAYHSASQTASGRGPIGKRFAAERARRTDPVRTSRR